MTVVLNGPVAFYFDTPAPIEAGGPDPISPACFRAHSGARIAQDGRAPVPWVCTCLHGRGINMNPRDFKKAAPYLGALFFLAVVVFTVVRLLP